jgi:hypothetical protein
MMVIVRLFPTHSLDSVWDFVIKKSEKYSKEDVSPLYISQIVGRNFISVIFEVEKVEQIVKFLIDQIAGCELISRTHTLTLVKPVFLPIPKDKPKSCFRYSVELKVSPKHYRNVYERLIEFKYDNTIFPLYISYVLGESDILLSMMAPNLDSLHKFLAEKVNTMEGVLEFTIYSISRSRPIADEKTWDNFQRSKLRIPSWLTSENMKEKYLYDYEIYGESMG